MTQKAFLNTDVLDYTSYIVTYISSFKYKIEITDCYNKVHLHSTGNNENDLYKLNTLVEHITNLRDRYLFLIENKSKIEKKYKTKEEAQQFLDYLKEKDNLFFKKYVVKTFKNKKETYYSIRQK